MDLSQSINNFTRPYLKGFIQRAAYNLHFDMATQELEDTWDASVKWTK